MLNDSTLPTREACDLTDPEERFVWMFLDLPPVKGGALILPVPMLKEISKHLSDAGAMLECPDCGCSPTPSVKWQRLPGHDPMLGSAGHWVDAATPDDDNAAVRDVLHSVKPDVHKALIDELASMYPNDDTIQQMKEGLI